MKKCTKCLQDKEVTEFYKHETGAQGLAAHCKQCKKISSDSWYLNNKKRKAITGSNWRAKNKQHVAELSAANYRKNLTANRAKRAKYNSEHKEKTKLRRQQYLKENPHLGRYWANKRRVIKLQRTPKWLTLSDWEKIEEYYQYATILTQVTGIFYEVDHIIPLQGKNISGLHCPENLQILTRFENRSKGHKF
jgi:hypothetical protein